MATDTLDKKDKLTSILERYQHGREADQENRKAAKEDWNFLVNADHWPAEEKKRRKGRPTLTIDKLSAFLHQITNDQRQNRPSIKIRPFDDTADKDTARVLQGLIRHIEYGSRAHIAYDTAYEQAVGAGIGFFRVLTEVRDAETNEQELIIRRINDFDSVTLDPDHQEPDASDAEWAFIETTMTRKAFKKEYPKVDPKDFETESDSSAAWFTSDRVRVAEYFEKTPDGIIWRKLCGSCILDEKPWAGRFIPVVVLYGDEKFVNGKRVYSGLTRRAKDPQRMYNYWASTYTEVVAMAPKSKFVGTATQFANLEAQWAAANTDNAAFLAYNADPKAPGAPQRVGAGEVPAGIAQGLLMASEDIKATTGIFDASMGRQGNETSGKAIMARQREGDTANYHYLDNLTTSIQHLGRILIDLIPVIYDSARIVRILGESGEEEMVGLNMPREAAPPGVETVVADLTIGQYDVVVEVGPAFATRRQEASENLMQLLQSVPQIGQVAGDLIVKSLDVEHADEIAQRIRNSLPPQITQQMGKDGKPMQAAPSPELMAAQQQLQAMGQQMQQMQEALQQAQAAAQDKGMERDTKLQEAHIKQQTELMKSQSEVEAARIEQETERMKIMIPLQAEEQKTVAVMEQVAQMDQVSAQRHAATMAALEQMQAQTMQMQGQLITLLSQPKQVVITRDAQGRINGATAAIEGAV